MFKFNKFNIVWKHNQNKFFLVKGNASTDSAGIIAAIADQVAKLEPKSPSPIISLQNDNR